MMKIDKVQFFAHPPLIKGQTPFSTENTQMFEQKSPLMLLITILFEDLACLNCYII